MSKKSPGGQAVRRIFSPFSPIVGGSWCLTLELRIIKWLFYGLQVNANGS